MERRSVLELPSFEELNKNDLILKTLDLSLTNQPLLGLGLCKDPR